MADHTPLSVRSNPRAASRLDHEIGARLKLARQMAGMSQSELASRVGVTFQQLQKYERGANRVPASRLFEFACVLQRPLGYFFVETDATGSPDTPVLTGFGNLSAEMASTILRTIDGCPSNVRDGLVKTILAAGRTGRLPNEA